MLALPPGHEDIDQVFAVVCHVVAASLVDDPQGVIDILSRLRPRGTTLQTHAYKLDEVANWKEWTERLYIKMHGLHDLHYIRFARREDIGQVLSGGGVQIDDFPIGVPPSPNDVIALTKGRLHDVDIFNWWLWSQLRAGEEPTIATYRGR